MIEAYLSLVNVGVKNIFDQFLAGCYVARIKCFTLIERNITTGGSLK